MTRFLECGDVTLTFLDGLVRKRYYAFTYGKESQVKFHMRHQTRSNWITKSILGGICLTLLTGCNQGGNEVTNSEIYSKEETPVGIQETLREYESILTSFRAIVDKSAGVGQWIAVQDPEISNCVPGSGVIDGPEDFVWGSTAIWVANIQDRESAVKAVNEVADQAKQFGFTNAAQTTDTDEVQEWDISDDVTGGQRKHLYLGISDRVLIAIRSACHPR